MNKKGTLIHWILFGMIAAIGIFLYITNSFYFAHALKGPWQLEVINSLLYESELDLLKLDLAARDAGQDVALGLAAQGGFVVSSLCGKEGTTNLWNNLGKWCYPPIDENVNELFANAFFKQQIQAFSPLVISGSKISSMGGKKSIVKEKPFLRSYTYDYSFTVDLGYSFDEYLTIQTEARKLVDTCRNRKDLLKCLDSEKLAHWDYQSCSQPQAPTAGRVWPFCVNSPNQASIQNKPIQYLLALDFTPITPFSVDEITVSYDPNNNRYEISFAKDDLAEEYVIYYSDAYLLDFKGEAKNILILSGTGQFLNSKDIPANSIIKDPFKCGSGNTKEAGKAYLCGETITYVLEDASLLESENYYFAAATRNKWGESEIALFVLG